MALGSMAVLKQRENSKEEHAGDNAGGTELPKTNALRHFADLTATVEKRKG